MKQTHLFRTILIAVSLALLAIFVLPEAVNSQTPVPTGAADGGASQFKIVGYFPQWGMYARQYRFKQVITTGAAPKLTHINYAFANVSTDSQCYEETRLGWGDSSADYEVGYSADQSVNGLPDDPSQKLKGHFNQIKELKAMYPDLKVLLSIGGFTWSGRFSDAAMPDKREAFVASCIDLFIKGNLPIWAHVPGSTPPPGNNNGKAAGVFDGIDIDWEYPAAPGFPGDPSRNLPPNVYRPEDTQNYTALVAEFRKQLDAYGQQMGKHYLLTIATPAGPDKYSKIELGKVQQYVDWLNVMTVDIHGGWDATGPTNFQAPLYSSPEDPSAPPNNISVDSTINAYLAAGVPPGKMLMEIPFYGRGWTGVPNKNHGLYQSDPAMQPAPGTWDAGIEDAKKLQALNFPSYRDPKTHAFWLYDGTTFWNYDDPQVIADKMAYIKQKKLGGTVIWSLDSDDGTLITAVYNGLH
ncbi:MAG TPA: glycoside hydrolase family 18 protein [Aggregatilineales bacterium]|nr:glycoside hydrolase family 18 protein [Aggregatilineales bacterium]